VHNPKTEAVAIAIMSAIRRYSEESPIDSRDDQGMTDEIEAALNGLYEELENGISRLELELENR
jgi:hypothetical protein